MSDKALRDKALIDPFSIDCVARFGNWWFGYQDQIIGRRECPYLHRRILYFGLWSVRYHIFHRSDEERALHDHPWGFWTFPINDYDEHYIDADGVEQFRTVKRFRFHRRRHGFAHRVVMSGENVARTFVFTCRKRSSWGFFVRGKFMPWRKWLGIYGLPPCADYEEAKDD